jgi:hypothetical protein
VIIVAMSSRATVLPETAHPKIVRIYEYWKKIAPKDGVLPGRRDIDPVDIPTLLENIWLLDVLGEPKRFRVRLIGENIRSLGNPVKPGDFLDQHLGDASPAVGDLRFVAAERQPLWFRGDAELHHTSTMFELERLFLPFAMDGATVDLILGAAVFYTLQGKLI